MDLPSLIQRHAQGLPTVIIAIVTLYYLRGQEKRKIQRGREAEREDNGGYPLPPMTAGGFPQELPTTGRNEVYG